MTPFSIHGSVVQHAPAAAALSSGLHLVALWPSPVEHDLCFRDAGFTEFGDNDDAWSERADAFLDRLLTELTTFGQPRLLSKPIESAGRTLLHPFRSSRVVDLREQITLPIAWDSLPECIVAFGGEGVTLRTGQGHHLFWITLRAGGPLDIEAFMHRVAGNEPFFQTTLRWECLL
jgi:hypothetical protein